MVNEEYAIVQATGFMLNQPELIVLTKYWGFFN